MFMAVSAGAAPTQNYAALTVAGLPGYYMLKHNDANQVIAITQDYDNATSIPKYNPNLLT
jgi:hypothetical protein